MKHAWYDGPAGRTPALLLKWRHLGDGHYDGFICTVVPDEDGFSLVELWVEASMLAPARTSTD